MNSKKGIFYEWFLDFCHHCGGYGKVQNAHLMPSYPVNDRLTVFWTWDRCPMCKGTGRLDHEEVDKADGDTPGGPGSEEV